MKSVEVRKQVRLSMAKCLELVLSGVRFRLFRAAITVVIISLATAFLMTMLGESLIGREAQIAIDMELAPLQRFLFWSSRLSAPISEQALADELADLTTGDARWMEFAGWGGLSDEQMARLKDIAQRQRVYSEYFVGLNEGIRRVLVGRNRGNRIFQHLQDPAALEAFDSSVKQLGQKLPTSPEAFASFLADWIETRPLRLGILTANASAVESLGRSLGGRTPKEALAEGKQELLDRLAECGFRMSSEELQQVASKAALSADAEQLAGMVALQAVKTRLAGFRNSEIADVDKPMLFDTLSSAKGTRWFCDLIAELKGKLQQIRAADAEGADLRPEEKKLLSQGKLLDEFELPEQRITEVAAGHERQSRLADIQANITDRSSAAGLFGFTGRTKWLIVVSFLVCVVGIANAMLMSVTERFREIATMKCLGATDGFIQTNFILESVMQGVAGGIIGMILGLFLGLLRSWAQYGNLAFARPPTSSIAQAAGLSLLVGIVVSALAAVYPARVAARLAPMEAMRIE